MQFKRGFHGTYDQMCSKHLLHRGINEGSGRHNERAKDTREILGGMAANLNGHRRTFKELLG